MYGKVISGKVRASVLFGALTLLISVPALAHHPVMERGDIRGPDDAIVFDDLTSSYAVYANLDRPGDVDWYRFEVRAPSPVKVSLLVPHRADYRDFYPVFAVIGPGLPAPASALPFDLPEDDGAVVLGKLDQPSRESFFEPFSLTRYYKGIEDFDRELTVPGTYYVAVWHPEGETGAYTLGFGTGEKWKLSEIPETITTVWLIQSGTWMTERGGPAGEAGSKTNDLRCGVGMAQTTPEPSMEHPASGVTLQAPALGCG